MTLYRNSIHCHFVRISQLTIIIIIIIIIAINQNAKTNLGRTYRRYIRVPKSPFNKAQYQRAFSNSTGAEYDDPVVIALFRHSDICRCDLFIPPLRRPLFAIALYDCSHQRCIISYRMHYNMMYSFSDEDDCLSCYFLFCFCLCPLCSLTCSSLFPQSFSVITGLVNL